MFDEHRQSPSPPIGVDCRHWQLPPHTGLCRLTLHTNCLPIRIVCHCSPFPSASPCHCHHSPAEAIISLILSNRCDHSSASIVHSLSLSLSFPFNCRLLQAECRSLTLLSALTNNLPRHYNYSCKYNNEMRRQECDCQLPS